MNTHNQDGREQRQDRPHPDLWVRQQSIVRVCDQMPLALAATLAVGGLTAAVFWSAQSSLLLVAWIGLLSVVTLARYLSLAPLKVRLRLHGPVSGIERPLLVGNFVSGLVWGAGAMVIMPSSPDMTYATFMGFVLAGVTAGAVPAYAPLSGAYPAFVVPALLPYALWFLLQGGFLAGVMGLLVLMYMGLLLTTSRRIREVVEDSTRTSVENEDLVQVLTQSQERMARINQRLAKEVRDRGAAQEALKESNALLNAVTQAQSQFIEQAGPFVVFDHMLSDVLDITDSEYGFIGEVLCREEDAPYLKTYALTNIAWNDETRRFYEENAPRGLEFDNLGTLFGQVIATREVVISNEPGRDPRAGGLPSGHPPLRAFLGLPFFHGSDLVGMVGIANRPGGYDARMVEYLQPLLKTCANVIHGIRTQQMRARAEMEVRDRGIYLSAILDNVADGIITWDREGCIRSINRAGQGVFDATAREMVGIEGHKLMAKSDRARFLTWFQRQREHPDGVAAEFLGQRSNGQEFPMEVSVRSMELGDQQLYVGVLRDITERRRVDRMKSEFVSTVSHELRTPLTSIRGALGLLEGGAVGELPNRATELIGIAQTNSERLGHLINDLLDMEKIESGRIQFDDRPLPVMPMVDSAVAQLQGYGAELGVEFAVIARWEEAVVYADEQRMLQVLSNLLSNAAKFSPPGERVEVAVAGRDNGVRISVSDRGPGIPPEFQDRLFDKFTQADASDTRSVGGTGLGLSISKAIVERLGGELSFATEPGRGTQFFVDLPSYQPQPASAATRA